MRAGRGWPRSCPSRSCSRARSRQGQTRQEPPVGLRVNREAQPREADERARRADPRFLRPDTRRAAGRLDELLVAALAEPCRVRRYRRQRDHGRRRHVPAGDAVGDPDLGRGQHRRHGLQRLALSALLLFRRLVLARQRRHLHPSEHTTVLLRPWHRLRRPGRRLRPDAREVDRSLPRVGMRRPGHGRLDLDQRRDVDDRPLRSQRRAATTASRAMSTTTRRARTTAGSTSPGTTSPSAAARFRSRPPRTAARPGLRR